MELIYLCSKDLEKLVLAEARPLRLPLAEELRGAAARRSDGGPNLLLGGAAAAMWCLLFQCLRRRAYYKAGFAVDCTAWLSLLGCRFKRYLQVVQLMVFEEHLRCHSYSNATAAA